MKIILCGRTSSGKTTIKTLLESKGLKSEVSYTTRLPRPNEIDGKDYHFTSVESFMEMVSNNEFLQWVEFKGNFYGTSLREYDESHIMIMTPSGIDKLSTKVRSECKVFLIDVPSGVIERRFINRGFEIEQINDRMIADSKIFDHFTNYDHRLDGTKKPKEIIESIYGFMKGSEPAYVL